MVIIRNPKRSSEKLTYRDRLDRQRTLNFRNHIWSREINLWILGGAWKSTGAIWQCWEITLLPQEMLETEKISPCICCRNLTPSLPRHPKITKNSFANTYFGQWSLTFSNQKTSEQKPSQGKSGLSQLERKRALAGAPQASSLGLAETERLGPKQRQHWVNKAFNSTIIDIYKIIKSRP